MIVDTSILIALMREEPQTSWIVPILSGNFGALKMSTANYLEAAIVIDANRDEVLSERLEAVIAHFGIDLVSVSAHHVRVARSAYRTYGKGNHRARLNFGDCFAYALAKTTGEPLLFKGDDFRQTDIIPAYAP
ncbi:type II toxin-antitoxin system VapC family toxin [Sphingomonas psychrotolerans]|uniref:Ribonuclease VapC n=1 Tax=Sphingomonas psychrotolerans TaxID=1327635 RepID=A0ABU3MY86_9SPHN|nr:type II toxin-antitoxin system VapC family toxin [Sphingomonas psychrotolerans]MDT8757273.1 type II toxin-antitoxin system VapC family toxin [Sphingomonas psychrotolerans]